MTTKIGMTFEEWRAQHPGEAYGQMHDGTSRTIARMQLERDADEGMRGYNGGSGTGDGPGHKQSFKGGGQIVNISMEDFCLFYG